MKYEKGKWYIYDGNYYIRCSEDSDGYPFHYSGYISNHKKYTRYASTVSSLIQEEIPLELILPHLPEHHEDQRPREMLLTTIL